MDGKYKYAIFVIWKVNPEKIGALDPGKWRDIEREAHQISLKYAETLTTTAYEPLHVGFRGADKIETDDISDFYALQEELHQQWAGLREGYATVTDVIITLNRDHAEKTRVKHRIN